jgi:PAS domain S-box-containing protein
MGHRVRVTHMSSNLKTTVPLNVLKLRRLYLLAFGMVFIAVVIILLIVDTIHHREEQQRQSRINDHAQWIASRIDAAIQERISALDRMGKRWEFAGVKSHAFLQYDADTFAQSIPGTESIYLVSSDGRLMWSVHGRPVKTGIAENIDAEEPMPLRQRSDQGKRLYRLIHPDSSLPKFVIERTLGDDAHDLGKITVIFRFQEIFDALNVEEHALGYHIIPKLTQAVSAHAATTSPRLWVASSPLNAGDGRWAITVQAEPKSIAKEVTPISHVVIYAGIGMVMLLACILLLWIKTTKEQDRVFELKTRWRFAVEGSGLGLWDWHLESDHVFYSPHWKFLLGYTKNEIGNTIEEWLKRIHPDDLAGVEAAQEAHLRGETPMFSQEYRLRCKDGEYKWFLSRGQVVSRRADQSTTRILGTLEDIHDRKLLADSLKNQEQLLRSILDHAPLGIWHLDKAGQPRFANQWICKILSIDESSFLSTPHYSMLFHPEIAQRAMALDMAAAVTEVPQSSVERLVFADGTPHELEITHIQLPSHSGTIGIAHDITERIRNEEMLRTHDALLRDVLQQQNVATFIIDHEHRVQHWNRACELLTGVTAQEIIGTQEAWRGFYQQPRPTLANLVLDQKKTEIAKYYSESPIVASAEPNWHAESWLDSLKGKSHYLIIDAAPIYDDKGNLTAVVETLQDLTEQKRIEESLRETETRFREIANTAPVMIWMTDTDQPSQFLNHTFQDFLGDAPSPERPQDWATRVHPDQRSAFLHLYLQAVENHEPFSTETRLLRHDGEYRWVAMTGIPRITQHYGFVGYIGTCLDIEDNKQIALKLQAEHEKTQQALKALEYQKFALDEHAIVTTTDSLGKITYANKKFTEISGYTEEELVGKDHNLVNSGFHPHGFFKNMYETIEQGSTWHGEVCNRSKSGELYWIETTVVPFMGSDHKPERYIAICTNITERKRAEAELLEHRDHLQELVLEQTAHLRASKEAAERANQAKSEFLANITHELRTPMHAILSFAELGETKCDQSSLEKLSGYFKRISSSGERLLSLLNNLLDLSKIEAGKMELQLHPYNLFKLAEDGLAECANLAASKQLKMVLEPSTCDTETLVDATRFGQIVRNLLSNAIKFTPAGGTITLRFISSEMRHGRRAEDVTMDPAIIFEVSDTGIGIPEQELETIFDKFVQSSKTKTNAGGTGLGLSICKEMAHAHHGTIRARNNPNGGATLSVTLPRIPASRDKSHERS